GLHQRERLHELVERTEATRHDDPGGRKFYEHHLACEEVMKGLADVLVGISGLFMRQLDIESHARAAAEKRTLVRGFHEARSTARNHAEAGIGKLARDLKGKKVIGMILRRSRAAEDAYRWPDGAQALRCLDEF